MRRKPRAPFVHVLSMDAQKPEAEQVRFTIIPPGELAWTELMDDASGRYGRCAEAVIRFVEKAEGPGTDGFGLAGSKERRAFVDECLGFEEMLELANVVSDTLLSVTERKNSASPSA